MDAGRGRGLAEAGLLSLAAAMMPMGGQAEELVAFGSRQPGQVMLEVRLNGFDTQRLYPFVDHGGRLSATSQALTAAGLDLSSLGLSSQEALPLDAIPGLRYRYDRAAQVVDLSLPDDLRRPYALSQVHHGSLPPTASSRGWLLNYDGYAQSDARHRLNLMSELRHFNQQGVLSHTGLLAVGPHQGHRYVRYDTSWTQSDQQSMRTLQVGDTISGALSWTRAVRMAGVQWGRNFALRPDLVTYPVAVLGASAVVPSAMSLYVNGVRRYEAHVPEGPFVINDMPGITGAGEAVLVTQDAQGRARTISIPMYVDPRMLAKGLSSYSLEAGFVRRNYGRRSFDYDARPVMSASGRYGFDDAWTLEAHTEGGADVFNAGVGAYARLGQRGVFNLAVSGSAGHYRGGQVSLGYQYVDRFFSVDVQSTRSWRGYGDLGSREGVVIPRSTDRATVSFPLGPTGRMGVSYVGFQLPKQSRTRVFSLMLNQSIHERASITVSAYRDMRQKSSGVFVSLMWSLDSRRQTGTTLSHREGATDAAAYMQQSVPYDGGWGWMAEAGRQDGKAYTQGRAEYIGTYGAVSGIAQQQGSQTRAALQATGALVWMGGSLQASRWIDDGFALVNTGMPDVQVLHEHRALGRTDASGHLLVSGLNSYQANHLSINPSDLPLDARVTQLGLKVAPQAKSGVLADLRIERMRGASVTVLQADGSFVPTGASVLHEPSGRRSVVGFEGLTYIDVLSRHNQLHIRGQGVNCTVTLPEIPDDAGPLAFLGPYTCQDMTKAGG